MGTPDAQNTSMWIKLKFFLSSLPTAFHFLHIKWLCWRKRFSEAEERIKRDINRVPNNPGNYVFLLDTLVAQDRFEEAEVLSHRVIELVHTLRTDINSQFPEEARPHLDNFETNVRYTLIYVLDKQNKLPETEAEIRRAIDFKPKDGVLWGMLAGNCKKQRKWAEAEFAYREAIRYLPKEESLVFPLVDTLKEQLKFSEAEDILRKTIASSPKNPLPHAILGFLLNEQNKPAEAEKLLRKAIKIFPNDGSLCFNLAASLQMQDKFFEAANFYHKAIRLDSSLVNKDLGFDKNSAV